MKVITAFLQLLCYSGGSFKLPVCYVVMCTWESWTIKKAERRRIGAFELRCWRRRLRVPWTTRRSNQPMLKEISPGTGCEELTHLKRPWCWERLKAGGEGDTEDEMVGWHHWLNGHGFEWTPGVGDGQGGLECCSPWGHKESDMTATEPNGTVHFNALVYSCCNLKKK